MADASEVVKTEPTDDDPEAWAAQGIYAESDSDGDEPLEEVDVENESTDSEGVEIEVLTESDEDASNVESTADAAALLPRPPMEHRTAASDPSAPAPAAQAVSTSVDDEPLSEGAKVSGRYLASTIGKFGTKWFPATVRALNANGTCDLLYEDGDAEVAVRREFIKKRQ